MIDEPIRVSMGFVHEGVTFTVSSNIWGVGPNFPWQVTQNYMSISAHIIVDLTVDRCFSSRECNLTRLYWRIKHKTQQNLNAYQQRLRFFNFVELCPMTIKTFWFSDMEKTKHRMTTEWAACLCTNQSDWWSGRQKKPGEVSIYKFRLTNTLATLLGCWYRQDVPCKVATEFTANKVEHFCLRLFESRLLVCGLQTSLPILTTHPWHQRGFFLHTNNAQRISSPFWDHFLWSLEKILPPQGMAD